MTDNPNPEADASTETPTPPVDEKTPIDSLPPDIQEYIRSLRHEAQGYREKLDAQQRKEQKAIEDAKRQEQEAKGEFQQIIADLEPKAAKADKYDAYFAARLEELKQQVPEDRRELIPQGAPDEQVAWIERAMAAGVFGQAQRPVPKTDAGATGDRSASTETVKLTAEQEALVKSVPGMTREKYVAHLTRLRGIKEDD